MEEKEGFRDTVEERIAVLWEMITVKTEITVIGNWELGMISENFQISLISAASRRGSFTRGWNTLLCLNIPGSTDLDRYKESQVHLSRIILRYG